MEKQTDFEELKGMEVSMLGLNGPGDYSLIKGIIADCHHDIGLTVVDIEDNDFNYICLTGPLSPLWKNISDEDYGYPHKENYSEAFYAIVEMIKNNREIDTFAIDKILGVDDDYNPFLCDIAECAFQ